MEPTEILNTLTTSIEKLERSLEIARTKPEQFHLVTLDYSMVVVPAGAGGLRLRQITGGLDEAIALPTTEAATRAMEGWNTMLTIEQRTRGCLVEWSAGTVILSTHRRNLVLLKAEVETAIAAAKLATEGGAQ